MCAGGHTQSAEEVAHYTWRGERGGEGRYLRKDCRHGTEINFAPVRAESVGHRVLFAQRDLCSKKLPCVGGEGMMETHKSAHSLFCCCCCCCCSKTAERVSLRSNPPPPPPPPRQDYPGFENWGVLAGKEQSVVVPRSSQWDDYGNGDCALSSLPVK